MAGGRGFLEAGSGIGFLDTHLERVCTVTILLVHTLINTVCWLCTSCVCLVHGGERFLSRMISI